MKLSIITVVYNDCHGIDNTLNSISLFSKNFQYDYELIIINGNSTDRTDSVINNHIVNFDKNITFYVNEPDTGIYDAMNKGIIHISESSDYCIFMNSGDCFKPQAANILTDFFNSSNNIPDIAIFPIESINADGQFIRVRKFNDINKLRVMPVVPHQSTLIRTNLMRSMMYDSNYKILADYDFFCKCYLKNLSIIYYETDPIALFLQGGVSNAYSKQIYLIFEIIKVQINNFKKINFCYLFVPLLKWIFFRFTIFRRLEFFFRKFI